MTRLLTVLLALALPLPPPGPALSEQSESKGRLVVLNKEDATLVVVDPGSGKVLGKGSAEAMFPP